MFTTLKSLSRRSILEIVTSGVMFDHMGAMLVSLLLTTIPEPYLSLSLLLTTIPGPYLSLPDVQVPISQTRPLDSDF